MSETDRSRRKPGTTLRARKLRDGGNFSEALLWNELKDRRLGGYKFVRQFPLGPYFADFACRTERLVVEVDGSQHAESDFDRRRDEFMSEAGFSVVRFWNTDVIAQMNSVCETILAILERRLVNAVVAIDLRFLPSQSPSRDIS